MVFVSLIMPSFAAEPTKDRFVSEYPPAAAALEAAAARDGKIKVVKVKTTTQSNPEKVRRDREEKTFWKSGSNVRVDTRIYASQLGSGDESGGEVLKSESSVVSANGRIFIVGRKSADEPFVFGGFGSSAPGIDLDRSVLLNAATTLQGKSIAQALQTPNFKVVDATEREEGGRRIVEVAYRRFTDAGKPAASGWMRFDPSRGWALVSYDYETIDKEGGENLTRITYADDLARLSPPIPRSIEAEGGVRIGENEIHITRHATFEPFDPAPIPDREFTLAAFGLSDPGQPLGDQSKSNLGFWLLVAAGVLLVVAVSLRLLATRSRRAVSS